MKLSQFVFVCIGACLMACSPYSKDRYLSQYDSFTEETQSHCDAYSDSEWEDRNAEMREFLGENYREFEEEFTEKEKARIWAQALVYYTCQYKEEVVDRIRNADEEELEQVREHIKLVSEASDEFLDELIPQLEKLGPELEEAGKELVQKLEDSGVLEELEKSLHKLGKKLEEIEIE